MTEQRRIRRFVQGLNVEIQKDHAVAQINAFSETVKKAQRVENARLQVRNFQAKKRGFPGSSSGQGDKSTPPKFGRGTGGGRMPGMSRGARQEVAKLGEVKEKVSKETRLLHLVDPAGIVESQTIRRTIARRRRENICITEVQTTNLPIVRFYHEMEGGANNRRGPIPNRLRWKGLNLRYQRECIH